MISYFRSTSNGDFLMVGLSTDVKPVTNIPNGARFLEMDTSKQYYFDESTLTYIEQASSSGNVFHGTVHITENGEYSVYGYAAADVNVEWTSGSINISENGEYDVEEYKTAKVHVPEPSGTITITTNGSHDVSDYNAADVGVIPQYIQFFTREITAYSDSTLSSIGSKAFKGCSYLSYVNTPNASIIGADAFDECMELLFVSADSVERIEETAFAYCGKLSRVRFPNVSWVGNNAFYNCEALAEVDLPNCLETSQFNTFGKCSNLVSVNLPKCSIFAASAFADCIALTSLSLPSLRSMGANGFNNCVNLISLYLMGSSVASGGNSMFTSTPIGGYSDIAGRFGSIYVPASLLSSYKSAYGWSQVSNRIVGVE